MYKKNKTEGLYPVYIAVQKILFTSTHNLHEYMADGWLTSPLFVIPSEAVW